GGWVGGKERRLALAARGDASGRLPRSSPPSCRPATAPGLPAEPAVAPPGQRPPFCCATMQYSIGIESIVLMREVMPASFAAAVFSSGVAGTRPKTFLWFGQMRKPNVNAL